LKNYAGRFLRQAILLLRFDVETSSIFRFLGDFSAKKTKIRRRKFGAIEGNTAARGTRQERAYLHSIDLGNVDAPTRGVFLRMGERHGTCAARRIGSIGIVAARQVRAARLSILTRP
jgi:hypothetical protein